ncbi:SHOCT domain-containing protein [Streptomyces wuyuanensis]|uniref:SHOCT domain-containing protein n=1 Tax=Streptomyces wuyuanensis TaxID=1196353 RepID=UPI00344A18C0
MNSLAHDGPGPWILLFPIVWAAVILGGITLLARTARRGRSGPWGRPHAMDGEWSPITLLGRRFAAGEIDEDEYGRRLSVLDEQFGPRAKGGPA